MTSLYGRVPRYVGRSVKHSIFGVFEQFSQPLLKNLSGLAHRCSRPRARDWVSHVLPELFLFKSCNGAGVGAAVSLREGVTTSAVDIKKIQEELLKQGVRIK